jgi:hypothetical protein
MFVSHSVGQLVGDIVSDCVDIGVGYLVGGINSCRVG